MNFTYVASGFILIGCSAGVQSSVCQHITYGPGSILYSKQSAINGKLEKVYIKKVRINSRQKNCWPNDLYQNDNVVILIDSYNEVWLEEELVPHLMALDLAEAYYEAELARIDRAFAENRCF